MRSKHPLPNDALFFPFLFRKSRDSPFQDLFYIVHVKTVTDAGYFLLPSVNHVPLLLTSAQPSPRHCRWSKGSSWGHVPVSTRVHKGTESCRDSSTSGPEDAKAGETRAAKEKAASSQKQQIPRRRPRTSLSEAFRAIPFPFPSSSTAELRRTQSWPCVPADTRGCPLAPSAFLLLVLAG